jgi:hypothetical protein
MENSSFGAICRLNHIFSRPRNVYDDTGKGGLFSLENLTKKIRMVSSGMLRRVALARTDISEESSASFIRVTKIGELGTTQAAACVVPPKRRFLQEPHGVTTQKTPFFIVTAVKTSNLTDAKMFLRSRATPMHEPDNLIAICEPVV